MQRRRRGAREAPRRRPTAHGPAPSRLPRSLSRQLGRTTRAPRRRSAESRRGGRRTRARVRGGTRGSCVYPGRAPRRRRSNMANVSMTWLGHAAFRFDTPGGKRIYLDPWLGNPKCPESERDPERMDVLALTHGHDDHSGDAPELMRRFSPTLVAAVELQNWIRGQGVDVGETPGMNKGGSKAVDGLTFTMTDARHSSSCPDGTYAGEAAGLVVEF